MLHQDFLTGAPVSFLTRNVEEEEEEAVAVALAALTEVAYVEVEVC